MEGAPKPKSFYERAKEIARAGVVAIPALLSVGEAEAKNTHQEVAVSQEEQEHFIQESRKGADAVIDNILNKGGDASAALWYTEQRENLAGASKEEVRLNVENYAKSPTAENAFAIGLAAAPSDAAAKFIEGKLEHFELPHGLVANMPASEIAKKSGHLSSDPRLLYTLPVDRASIEKLNRSVAVSPVKDAPTMSPITAAKYGGIGSAKLGKFLNDTKTEALISKNIIAELSLVENDAGSNQKQVVEKEVKDILVERVKIGGESLFGRGVLLLSEDDGTVKAFTGVNEALDGEHTVSRFAAENWESLRTEIAHSEAGAIVINLPVSEKGVRVSTASADTISPEMFAEALTEREAGKTVSDVGLIFGAGYTENFVRELESQLVAHNAPLPKFVITFSLYDYPVMNENPYGPLVAKPNATFGDLFKMSPVQEGETFTVFVPGTTTAGEPYWRGIW